MTQAVYDTQAAANLFRALAHPMRLQILYRLLDGEVSVTGLEIELGLRQPNLSQQLGHLRDAELVTTRRELKSVWYSLADDRIRATVEALREFWAGHRRPQGYPHGRPKGRPSGGGKRSFPASSRRRPGHINLICYPPPSKSWSAGSSQLWGGRFHRVGSGGQAGQRCARSAAVSLH